MARIRAALSMIMMTLVGPLSLMLLGVVALALFRGEGTGHDGRAVPPRLRLDVDYSRVVEIHVLLEALEQSSILIQKQRDENRFGPS